MLLMQAVEEECAQEIESGTNVRLYRRLKDGLESARTLIGCLRREKWRLNRRRMSVELRLGEMDDYKKHIKRDMVYITPCMIIFIIYMYYIV
jgi:hypothetical protein